MDSFGKRFKKLLEHENLTQLQMAVKLNISPQTLSKNLQDHVNPRLDTLQKIFTAFPLLNARWLIMGSGDMWMDQPDRLEKEPPVYYNDLLKVVKEQQEVLMDLVKQQHEQREKDPEHHEPQTP